MVKAALGHCGVHPLLPGAPGGRVTSHLWEQRHGPIFLSARSHLLCSAGVAGPISASLHARARRKEPLLTKAISLPAPGNATEGGFIQVTALKRLTGAMGYSSIQMPSRHAWKM